MGNICEIYQIYRNTITTSGSFSNTIFVKAAERSKIRVNSGSSSEQVKFDLSNGTIISRVGATADIVSMSNGWYKCTISWSIGFNAAQYLFVGILDDNGNITYQGNGSSGVYIWGAQFEQASYPTSYIPTYGSAVTRSNDSCLATGISDLIGQTEGTMFVEIDQPYTDGVRGAWAISDGSSTNRITMNTLDVNTTTFKLSIATNYAGGSTKLASVDKTYGLHKVVIQYSGTTLKLFVDGALADSVTTDGFGNFTNFYVGSNQTGVGDEIREIKQALLFPTALTDSECIALTTI